MKNKPLLDFLVLFTSIFFISGGIMLITGIDTVDIWWVNYVYYVMIAFMLINGCFYAYMYDKLVRRDKKDNENK